MITMIRNRQCWTIEHRTLQGKPLFLAACIWCANRDYVYTTNQYAESAEAALAMLEHAMKMGEA